MALKKTITIIGATDELAAALAGKLAGASRLLLVDKHLQKLELLTEHIKHHSGSADVEISACETDACWEADVIITALPATIDAALMEKIREVSTQKTVISIWHQQRADTSTPEQWQEQLPHAHVVSACNGLDAEALVNQTAVTDFIASNDEDALDTVSELWSGAGLAPVRAGSLKNCMLLEQMTALLQEIKERNHFQNASWSIQH
jgi:8-hydroxy-5-deazaflavin:NADPH oxidoreductase